MKRIAWTDRMADREHSGGWAHIPIRGLHDARLHPSLMRIDVYMLTGGSVAGGHLDRWPVTTAEQAAILRGAA